MNILAQELLSNKNAREKKLQEKLALDARAFSPWEDVGN